MKRTVNTSAAAIRRLAGKARWVWEQTLLVHKTAPETRLASSLSAVEIFTALYYGGFLKFNPKDPLNSHRDRLIASKGHGSIALYPILADLGFFSLKELESVSAHGSFLGAIPDPIIPGYETCNGSLGHGPGVACGMALALLRKGMKNRVVVVVGDGELHEGSVWEAIMFASHHKLGNLLMIIDSNTKCMLNHTRQILNIFPLAPKFKEFGWNTEEVCGHDIGALLRKLKSIGSRRTDKPTVLIANTIKGHGVPSLENDPLCHIRSLSGSEIDKIIKNTNAYNS